MKRCRAEKSRGAAAGERRCVGDSGQHTQAGFPTARGGRSAEEGDSVAAGTAGAAGDSGWRSGGASRANLARRLMRLKRPVTSRKLRSASRDETAFASKPPIIAGKARFWLAEAVSRQRANFAMNAGNQLMLRGQIADAISRYQESVAADPTFAEPHTQLASRTSARAAQTKRPQSARRQQSWARRSRILLRNNERKNDQLYVALLCVERSEEVW